MTEVVWTSAALRHLAAIKSYIQGFNARAAHDVAASLKASGDSLQLFPHRGRAVPRTNFRELVSTYPYVIRYAIEGDTVVILRIRHTARRPTSP